MVLYYTGTGNSRYGAQLIAKDLDDELVSINTYLRNRKKKKEFESKKPFVIVSPIYAWRLPKIIEKFIKESTFSGIRKIYFVATMGKETGRANKYIKKICEEKGLKFMGFTGVQMPEDYIIRFTIPEESEVTDIIEKGEKKFHEISKKIESQEVIKKEDKTPFAFIKSGPANSLFTKFMTKTKKFYVTDECVSCHKCEKLCPMNNIKFKKKEKKPTFGENCNHCTACIQNCPVRAIEVKRKTEGKVRYVCPKNIEENE